MPVVHLRRTEESEPRKELSIDRSTCASSVLYNETVGHRNQQECDCDWQICAADWHRFYWSFSEQNNHKSNGNVYHLYEYYGFTVTHTFLSDSLLAPPETLLMAGTDTCTVLPEISEIVSNGGMTVLQ